MYSVQQLAVHEAGHALACLRVGQPFRSLHVAADGSSGEVSGVGSLPRGLDGALADLLMLVAGGLAEDVYLDDHRRRLSVLLLLDVDSPPPGDYEDDAVRALGLAEVLAHRRHPEARGRVLRRLAVRYVEDAEAVALPMLRQCWPAVLRLADAVRLVAPRAVSYGRAVQLLTGRGDS